ncbi:hypothetical protein PSP6_500069 [Paraburkholderia tropica]|nr:hypothetical protein PSP6_500069 [Paraburkholderia tropica]
MPLTSKSIATFSIERAGTRGKALDVLMRRCEMKTGDLRVSRFYLRGAWRQGACGGRSVHGGRTGPTTPARIATNRHAHRPQAETLCASSPPRVARHGSPETSRQHSRTPESKVQ